MSEPTRLVRASKFVGAQVAAVMVFVTLASGIFLWSTSWGWWLVGPRVEMLLDDSFPGLRDSPETLDKVVREVRVIRRGVDNNRRRIEDLSASQRIARYNQDPGSSRVFGPCPRGELCRVRFELARTDYGIGCDIVQGQPFVANHSGEPHETFYEPQPNDVEWVPATTFKPFVRSFRVPQAVELGESSFYVKIVYQGCDPDDKDRLESESTISLRFDVIE